MCIPWQLIDGFLEYVWRFSDALFPQALHLGTLFAVCFFKLHPIFKKDVEWLEVLRLGVISFQIASIGLGACAALFDAPNGEYGGKAHHLVRLNDGACALWGIRGHTCMS